MCLFSLKRKRKEKGFTVVEMIVSVLLLSILGGVLYTTFSQGVKLWRFAIRERSEWNMDVFFEKLSDELRSAYREREPAFRGKADSFEFYALIPDLVSYGKGSPEKVKTPVQLRYSLDGTTQTVVRDKWVYPQVLSEKKGTGSRSSVVDKVTDLRLEYYFYDKDKQTRTWKNNWEVECLPEAVKVSLGYGDHEKMIRYISIPAAQGCR